MTLNPNGWKRVAGRQKLITVLLLLGFAALVIHNAWLCDDAYITFRTIDNFIHGYGLTWNIAERVQTYTHPLWMLALSAVYFFTREIFFSSQLFSVVVSLLAVAIASIGSARSPAMGWLGIAALTLSKAFIDYATSGLENPLTHLLLALFLLVYLREGLDLKKLYLLVLIASLGVVNRDDTILLYAPALAWLWFKLRGVKSASVIVLGFMPFIAWELFSLFYYGFPFPNTAYAKLDSSLINRMDWIREGGYYLLNSLRADPLTLTMVGLGCALPVLTKAWRKLPIVLGVALYLAYIVYIGGDFMSGRFLTAPLFVAVVLLMSSRLPSSRVIPAVMMGGILLVGLSAPFSPFTASDGDGGHDGNPAWIRGRTISDEWAYYSPHTSLLRAIQQSVALPDHEWALHGREVRANGPSVIEIRTVGFFGYFAGPKVYVLDLLGLGNPLLARLPPDEWRVGHLERKTPQGYIETLSQGGNHIADPNLSVYYSKLELIIRGNLFDLNRLREIWQFNTGAYDHYLDAYAYFRGTTFTRRYQIVNPTDRPYVYAYVWNNGAGETFLLDDASRQGSVYTITWTISVGGVRLEGQYKKVASIGKLSDAQPLMIGVLFGQTPEMVQLQTFERRFRFQIQKDGRLAVVLPGRGYYNAEMPQGYWVPTDLDNVMREQPNGD